jgi:nitrite reductase [NAD(P)H] large subunit
MSEPLVVVGNGMATARFVDELATRCLGRYAIAVIGEEPRLAYNRVLLSSVLAGAVPLSEIELRPPKWWTDRGVTLLYGHRAVAIDHDIRRVRLASGATLPYSHLVLATGSKPIRLRVSGCELPGVLTFRDLGDVVALRTAAVKGTSAVVIGGGLLGLEAAYGLARAGVNVAIVHLMDRLMERQLDGRSAAMLKLAIERQGVSVHLQAETAAIRGGRRAEVVELADGRRLPADLVVMAVGIHPNTELAASAGLNVNRGIEVDDGLQTSRNGIYAIGECAEHRGTCYGLVEPAYEQARVLAQCLAGTAAAKYPGSVLATNLKVSGVHVFSAGEFLGGSGTNEIVFADPGLGIYKKLVLAGDRLVGTVLYGDTADGLWYLDLIRSGAPIVGIRDDLAFGRVLTERRAA